jgi:FkbM family methyltransferase
VTTVGAVQSLSLHNFPPDIKVAYEIGSRDALDALYMANEVGWEVHAFEPNPNQISECVANANKSDLVSFHELAILDVEGRVQFHRCLGHKDQVGSSSILPISPLFNDPDYTSPNVWANPLGVSSSRIDTLIDSGVIPPAQFAQIDVQGVELKVLKSFGRWIDSLICCVVEVSKKPQYEGSDLEPEITQFLNESGFIEASRRTTSPKAWFDEVLYVKEKWADESKSWGWGGSRV